MHLWRVIGIDIQHKRNIEVITLDIRRRERDVITTHVGNIRQANKAQIAGDKLQPGRQRCAIG